MLKNTRFIDKDTLKQMQVKIKNAPITDPIALVVAFPRNLEEK